MNIRRCAITAWLCAIAAGCGASNPVGQLSPSAVTTTGSSVSGATTQQLSAQSIGSCPDGNSPTWLQTWTKGGTARLRWTEVAPNIEYHVVVEHYDVSNKFVPVENGNFFVVNQTWAEMTLSEGRYRAKIQTRSCGRFMGPWSDELSFSVEGNEVPTVPPPTNEAPTPSGESAEGTLVPSAANLTTASGDVWTLGAPLSTPYGPAFEVALNGVVFDGVWATQLKYHDHNVYLHGPDGHWYLAQGGWIDVGTVEP
jgi:hypothetical protein